MSEKWGERGQVGRVRRVGGGEIDRVEEKRWGSETEKYWEKLLIILFLRDGWLSL